MNLEKKILCKSCTEWMRFASEELQNKKTEKKSALYTLCSHIRFEQLKDTCHAYVDNSLVDLSNPNLFCNEFCEYSSDLTESFPTLNKKNDLIPWNDSNNQESDCAICTLKYNVYILETKT